MAVQKSRRSREGGLTTAHESSKSPRTTKPGQSHMEFAVVEGWRRLLGEWRYQLGRGCRNAEEPASVRSFARSKGSSAVNHLPDFSYASALGLRTCTQNNYFDQCVVYRGSTAMTLPLLSTARLTFLPSGVETIARLLSRQLIRSQSIDLERF